jgi:N-methylhydantoinase A
MTRLAVDIGGTFTDAVILDDRGGIQFSKVPSTPEDYSGGLLNSIDKLQVDLEQVEFFAHGTTTCLNALVMGKLAKTGLLTTKGFRDVLEIGRGNRIEIYNLFYKYPPALVPRAMRLEVGERTLSDGSVHAPLNTTDAMNAIRKLRKVGAQAVAICLIHAYANPQHEQELRDMVTREYPDAVVCASHELSREYYEYERTCTTVINAGLMPLFGKYLTSLEQELGKRKFHHELYIMQSNGGITTSTVAKTQPVMAINSGLVGGIIAVRELAQLLDYPDVIGADMGGTSFDVELVMGGDFQLRQMMRVETPKSGPDGYPILVPTVDLYYIGAGGGSVAWIDGAGALHVGPQSNGASPGPACYGKGGDEPTVTDANVVLGRINPSYFLGGDMEIYPELSRGAIGRIADSCGMDLMEAAAGIIRIVVSNMAGAIHTTTTKKGIDPRHLRMISFGGAGPLHSNLIQQELQIPEVVVTTIPGNTSAWGMLLADVKHDYVQSHVERLDTAEATKLEKLYQEIEQQARRVLVREGVPNERMQLFRSMDIRYLGQGHALTVPLLQNELVEGAKTKLGAMFDDQHLRTYLNNAPQERKEIVALRLMAIGLEQKVTIPEVKMGSRNPERSALKEQRDVFIDNQYVGCPIYERAKLRAKNLIEGPAVIEETASTILVLPDYQAQINRYGHCVIRHEGTLA